MQSEQDHYRVLSIAPDASDEEIKEAYRKLALQYHPDRNPASQDASQKMKEINAAYAVLSDPLKRVEYDIPRGYRSKVPKFQKGSKVKVSLTSASPYRGRTGVVDKEPVKDSFRFWYMVKFESRGLPTISRFAEEELEAAAG
jgi:curved DNA-binding protein CbpA